MHEKSVAYYMYSIVEVAFSNENLCLKHNKTDEKSNYEVVATSKCMLLLKRVLIVEPCIMKCGLI